MYSTPNMDASYDAKAPEEQSQVVGDVVLDFSKIKKIAVDLFSAKVDTNEIPIRNTYRRFILIDDEWVPLSDNYYYDKEFKEYIELHFEKDPQVEDEGSTLFFTRKSPEAINGVI